MLQMAQDLGCRSTRMRKILILIIFVILLIFTLLSLFPSEILNTLRQQALPHGGTGCLSNLRAYTRDFKTLGTFSERDCIVKNAVRVNSYKDTKLSGPITLSCPMALRFGEYLQELKPNNITHNGSYNCRKISSSIMLSEHSYGNAIDITKIDEASVLSDWIKITSNGKKIQKSYDLACKYFSNILSPDSNEAHRDHLHLDIGFGRACYLKWLTD